MAVILATSAGVRHMHEAENERKTTMSCFGAFLIVAGIPLVIGYFVGGRKNKMWVRLGITSVIIGVAVLFVK